MRRESPGTKDTLRSRLIIGILCFENVRHEFLWIAIVDWKPCALHLHHYAMSFQKAVVVSARDAVRRAHENYRQWLINVLWYEVFRVEVRAVAHRYHRGRLVESVSDVGRGLSAEWIR